MIRDPKAESDELSSNSLNNSGSYNNRLHSYLHTLHNHSNNHSQSALEYMMTYGWAILIIVIVAVVLYSMGIFSPSNLIAPISITGLSGFSPATAEFTANGGILLNIGNSLGQIINITSVTVISSIGTNKTIPVSSILGDGQSAYIFLPNIIPSNQQHTSQSLSIVVNYKEPDSTFPKAVYSSKGNVKGTVPTFSSPIAIYSIPITITNTQSIATPNPFQQMINASSSIYSTYAASNLDNVYFFYLNGTIIPSWLENYTSTNAIWWIKIGSIAPGASTKIYMGFASTSTNLFNTVNDGEAPQLSPTYGEYDDGANVFDLYFNGNTPTSDFVTGGGDTVTQETGVSFGSSSINAIRFTTGSSEAATTVDMYTAASLPNNPDYYISEASFQSDGSGTDMDWGLAQNSGTATSDNAIFAGTQYGSAYFDEAYLSGGSRFSDLNAQGTTTTAWRYSSLTYSNSSEFYAYIAPQLYSTTGGYSGTVSTNPISSISTLYWGWWGDVGASGKWVQFNWVRVRAYPPNGVMPSVSFGMIS